MRATVVILAWLVGSSAFAAEIEGVYFSDRYDAAGTPLVLNGVGLMRYRILFRGYVAALYLGENVAPQEVFSDVPKRLELEYFWSIEGRSFGPAGEEILAQNVPAGVIERLRPRLEQIDRLYPDVAPGDRLSLTYVPGRGTELAKNGSPVGTIEGGDFASAYFTIWLGREPMSAPLRDALLAPR